MSVSGGDEATSTHARIAAFAMQHTFSRSKKAAAIRAASRNLMFLLAGNQVTQMNAARDPAKLTEFGQRIIEQKNNLAKGIRESVSSANIAVLNEKAEGDLAEYWNYTSDQRDEKWNPVGNKSTRSAYTSCLKFMRNRVEVAWARFYQSGKKAAGDITNESIQAASAAAAEGSSGGIKPIRKGHGVPDRAAQRREEWLTTHVEAGGCQRRGGARTMREVFEGTTSRKCAAEAVALFDSEAKRLESERKTKKRKRGEEDDAEDPLIEEDAAELRQAHSKLKITRQHYAKLLSPTA
jgi:hypothetical protein